MSNESTDQEKGIVDCSKLRYFQLDLYFFDSYEADILSEDFGNSGITFYLYMLSILARSPKGEFNLNIDYKDRVVHSLCKKMRINDTEFFNILTLCTELGLFDKDAYVSKNILVSPDLSYSIKKYEEKKENNRVRQQKKRNVTNQSQDVTNQSQVVTNQSQVVTHPSRPVRTESNQSNLTNEMKLDLIVDGDGEKKSADADFSAVLCNLTRLIDDDDGSSNTKTAIVRKATAIIGVPVDTWNEWSNSFKFSKFIAKSFGIFCYLVMKYKNGEVVPDPLSYFLSCIENDRQSLLAFKGDKSK
jgi:hypothetical protein